MRALVDFVGVMLLGVAWLAGVVLAAGWWKLLAIVVPFYAWYLVVERTMQMLGVMR